MRLPTESKSPSPGREETAVGRGDSGGKRRGISAPTQLWSPWDADSEGQCRAQRLLSVRLSAHRVRPHAPLCVVLPGGLGMFNWVPTLAVTPTRVLVSLTGCEGSRLSFLPDTLIFQPNHPPVPNLGGVPSKPGCS